ncbi:archaeal/vacuolar-type H -ATPase subunit C [Cenarchaeum symbiosum A]|uniref:Archaeal/vacuolar-type H-ATPase subunit C n=1 Tax=Cenarchaeum symbiosum (strain A) TaxID=414004 RepID=A0RXL1_CENSY|nr:archaeal/vacuolar-type H -ATPase subunit C [Cenarchaeum symbiosum A]
MASGSQKVYASVKSFSQRGKLLSRDDLQTLAESRNLDELLTRIKNTSYSDAVSDVPKPLTAEGIEAVLMAHLADVHYSIAKTAGNKVLEAYFLRFMARNLKVILKGKILGRPQDEIEAGVNMHAEELIRQRDVILKALMSKDLGEAASSLGGTVFGEDAAKAVALYNETENLQVMDTYFDKALARQLGRALQLAGDRDLSGPVTMDIDFYNLLSVLRGKFWGLGEQQVMDLMDTYSPSAPREMLARMAAAGTLKDAFAELQGTRYRDLAPKAEDGIGAITEFERSFEMMMYRGALSSFTRMFSSGTSVGITKLTAYEIRNMAAIAFAVEHGIPVETTMSKLVVEAE